jgi:hypothetical protein
MRRRQNVAQYTLLASWMSETLSTLDISELLAAERDTGWETVGVVVSGPAMLCDDARAAAGRGKTKFEFEIEAYSWKSMRQLGSHNLQA